MLIREEKSTKDERKTKASEDEWKVGMKAK